MPDYVWVQYELRDESCVRMEVVAHDAKQERFAATVGLRPDTIDTWDELCDCLRGLRWDELASRISGLCAKKGIDLIDRGMDAPFSVFAPWLPDNGIERQLVDSPQEGVALVRQWARDQRLPESYDRRYCDLGDADAVASLTRGDAVAEVASIGWQFSRDGWDPFEDGVSVDDVARMWRCTEHPWRVLRDAKEVWRDERDEILATDVAGFPWCVFLPVGSRSWRLYALCRSEHVARLLAQCHDMCLEGRARVAHVVGAAPEQTTRPDDVAVLVQEPDRLRERRHSGVPSQVAAISQGKLEGLPDFPSVEACVADFEDKRRRKVILLEYFNEDPRKGTAWEDLALRGHFATRTHVFDVLYFMRDGEDEPVGIWPLGEEGCSEEGYEGDGGIWEAVFRAYAREWVDTAVSCHARESGLGLDDCVEARLEESVTFCGIPVTGRVVARESLPLRHPWVRRFL